MYKDHQLKQMENLPASLWATRFSPNKSNSEKKWMANTPPEKIYVVDGLPKSTSLTYPIMYFLDELSAVTYYNGKLQEAITATQAAIDSWQQQKDELKSLVVPVIQDECDILKYLSSESQDQAKRHIYKATECGASIHFRDNGITIGSIVEGADCDTTYHELDYPFLVKDFSEAVDEVEAEAEAIWIEWNEEGAQ